MSDSKCPSCGAKAVPPSLDDGLARYECGEWPCDPCPNAERLLAEARATIARQEPIVTAAVHRAERKRIHRNCRNYKALYAASCKLMDAEKALDDAVDAYRGAK